MSQSEIEVLVRQEVAKQVRNLAIAANTASFTADDYDFQIAPGNIFPGRDWLYVEALAFGTQVVIVWRKSRTLITQQGEQFIMPNTKQVPTAR